MISVLGYHRVVDGHNDWSFWNEGVCLSTDTKPADWPNGSVIIEMDTADVYMYNADTEEWVKL